MAFSDNVRKTFVVEATDLLGQFEQILLDIERGSTNPEQINQLFRAAHTIKGGAAMFGFNELKKVTHQLESILANYRSNNKILDANEVRVLLKLVDLLRQGVQASINENFGENLQQEIDSLFTALDQVKTISSSNPKAEISTDQIRLKQEEIVANIKESHAPHKPTADFNYDLPLKIDATKIDQIIDLVGEIVLLRSTLLNQKNSIDPEHNLKLEKLYNLIDNLREVSLHLRMIPVRELFNQFNRVVRDIAEQQQKKIVLKINGSDTQLDKTIINALHEPLLHLIRNACDHGIEGPATRITQNKPELGVVELAATQQNNEVVITISDNGKGIELQKVKNKAIELKLIQPEETDIDKILNCIFLPGFSTQDRVNEISGRGVGMDVVKKNIERLQGNIKIHSNLGEGTIIKLTLPLTLAIIDALLVKLGEFFVLIPVWQVVECVEIAKQEYQNIYATNKLNFRNKVLPIIKLNEIFNLPKTDFNHVTIIIVNAGNRIVGLVVNELLGGVQSVVKPMPPLINNLPWVNGVTILGNGAVGIIIDLAGMVEMLTVVEHNIMVLNE